MLVDSDTKRIIKACKSRSVSDLFFLYVVFACNNNLDTIVYILYTINVCYLIYGFFATP